MPGVCFTAQLLPQDGHLETGSLPDGMPVFRAFDSSSQIPVQSQLPCVCVSVSVHILATAREGESLQA